MGEDAEVISGVGVGQTLAVIARDGGYLGPRARERDRRRCDLDAAQLSAEAARGQLAEHRAVAAADVERARRIEVRALAERDHVIRLADGAERAPAAEQLGLRGVLGVAVLVERGKRR